MDTEVKTETASEQFERMIAVKGMYHIQIAEADGRIVGDSGWRENLVTNEGFRQYLVMAIGSISGSKYISHVGLGTGAGPAASDTSLGSEVGTRQAVTPSSTVAGSKTVRFTATFAAGWHTSASAFNISSIGLFNSSATGTLFSGTTYASSSCASNQAVNITYDLVFS
jgi:hypothetical protein